MSFTHTGLGVAAIVAIGTALIQSVAPTPKPITVHEIKYDADIGLVIQDRTVRVEDDGPFFAEWRADVIDASTGMPVPDCTGSGSWNYEAGRIEAAMTLARWTGTDCAVSDLPDEFSLRATWRWGADQTSAQSRVYTSEGAE